MSLWIIYALLSAISAAAVAIFGKLGIKNIDSTLATTVRSIVMALFLILVSLTLNKFQQVSTINSKAWLYIVLAGVAGATSWLFYFYALKQGPASSVAALDRLSVVFVLILATLFLGEKLSWYSAIGALMITGGAILMTLK